MGNHDRPRPLSLRTAAITATTALLSMSSTTTALSLSNFQLITSTQVPLGCILAYNRPISSCVPRDFTRGSVCTADCVDALVRLQSTLQAVCGDGTEPASSLLGQAMLGTLVDVLCPAASGLTTTSSFSSTVTKLTLTTVRTTTERPPTVTSSSSSSGSATSTDTPRASDIPAAPVPAPTIPSDGGGGAAQTTGSGKPTTTTSSKPEEGNPNSELGLGSPFDDPEVFSNLSPGRIEARWLRAASLAALVLGVVLLR